MSAAMLPPRADAAELEDTAQALRRAALAVSSAQGDDVFPDLVRTLADVLGVEISFIALRVEGDLSSLEMRAMVLDGVLSEGVRYALEGTPCATVVGRGFCAYPSRLVELFPLDSAFARMGAESYAAFPINDSQGQALGLIAVVSRRPLQHLERVESILQIYAVRAAAEIERMRSEHALRGREEQYRAVFEGSTDALGVWSGDMRIVDVNRAYTRMYGFAREEVIGRGFNARLSPQEVAPRVERMQRALAGEEGVLETHALRKNGERFEVELRYLPIVYRDEPHVLVIARDITERKAAEQALRLREEQYRVIFEASSDAFVLRDARGRTLDANPAFYRMYGFTREHIAAGGGYPASFPRDYVEEREAQVRRALQGESTHVETVALRADGSPFWIELRVIPVSYRGEPHVLQVVRDITERKAATAALQSSEEQYRAIFNASADALVLWDSQYRRVDVNPAYERIFGWSREEVVGRGYDRPGDGWEYAEPRQGLVRRALAGEICHAELTSRRKDGTTFLLEVDAIPFRHRGEPHVLAIARDITSRRAAEAERTELEAQLRQAQKMEAIGQLTGGIAHDFNNILTSVIGYLVLAGERAERLGDARLSRQLEQAHVAAQRARDLIAQMLAFARRRRGELRVVALAPVVRQAVQLLRATLPSTIELDHLEREGEPEAPPVKADPVQLEQVLFNLCINARDAIGGAGRIRVQLRERCAGGWHCASCRERVDEGRWIELVVADDGSGIAPDVLERMFDPFFSTKEVGRGSGMGLAMVHGIVHGHNGHIVVETSPGYGSTFRIVLPPAPESAGAPARQDVARRGPPAPPLHGRVMVVEDEAMVGAFMFELLEGWGLEVVLQRDPQAALRWLSDPARPLDLVVTDQTMPHLTGLELAQRAAALRPGMPIIIYTGDAGDFDEAQLQRSGVRTLLRKPLDPEALKAAIRPLLPTP